MKRRLLTLLLAIGAAIAAVPIGGGATRLAQDPEVGQGEQRPPLAIPPGYRYDPRGRRDPFVNPVPEPVVDTGPVIPTVRPPGLPGVLLNEATLVGVVTSLQRSMNVVVILAPGNRTFFAGAGDELLDAVVKEIRPDAVVFEIKPLEGQQEPERRREVVRPLNPAPGE